MTLYATYFGSSSWLIEFEKMRVLVDPWFTGNLSFPPGPWLIEGKLNSQFELPPNLDLILLTQGLADHAHPKTLSIIPKHVPVFGSFSAASVANELGFESIDALKPQDSKTINGLEVIATKGAPVPSFENGYLLSDGEANIYIEPHGYLDKDLASKDLDAVITPVVNLKLPLAGKFIRGKDVLIDLVELFNPKVIFASTVGGDASFSGIVNDLIKVEGSNEQANELLTGKTHFIDPLPGKRYKLETEKGIRNGF